MRAKVLAEFKVIMDQAKEMGSSVGAGELEIPRRCGRQTERANVDASSPEEYWRKECVCPLLDHVLQEFYSRFSILSHVAFQGLKLIPANLEQLSKSDAEAIVKHFSHDLPAKQSFKQEVRLWR